MLRNTIRSRRPLRLLAVAAVLLALADTSRAGDVMALRVNDAEGAPGDLIAVVIRTYSPRAVSQGQMSVRARRKSARETTSRSHRAGAAAPAAPFLSLEGYEVFSGRNDVIAAAALGIKGGEQFVDLQFASASGSINRADGPIAVLYLRLSDAAVPGDEFELSIEPATATVLGPEGETITLRPKPGRLRVKGGDDDHDLEVEGDRVRPGETAHLAIRSFAPVAIKRAEIALRYDPAIADAPPIVTLDRRHGTRRFRVRHPEPGLTRVTVVSRDASWNVVPGDILEVALPTSVDVRSGTRSRLDIDDELTRVVDGGGLEVPFDLGGATIRFVGKPASGEEFAGRVDDVDRRDGRIDLGDGTTIRIDGATAWDPDGDVTGIAALARAFDDGDEVSVEGRGQLQADGAVLAVLLKAELGGDDDGGGGGDDDGDDDGGGGDDGGDGGGGDDGGDDGVVERFADAVASVQFATSTLILGDGLVVRVDRNTEWDPSGDALDLGAVDDAVDRGDDVEAKGRGERQADGSILADRLEVSIDAADLLEKFKGIVASVDEAAGIVELDDGERIQIDGETLWDPSGDTVDLATVAAAVTAGDEVQLEGEGERLGSGAIHAVEVKAKID